MDQDLEDLKKELKNNPLEPIYQASLQAITYLEAKLKLYSDTLKALGEKVSDD